MEKCLIACALSKHYQASCPEHTLKTHATPVVKLQVLAIKTQTHQKAFPVKHTFLCSCEKQISKAEN